MNYFEKLGLIMFMTGLVMELRPSHAEWIILLGGLRLIGAFLFLAGDQFLKRNK